MATEIFFVLTKDEVQNFAMEIVGKELNENEFNNVKKMFEFGIEAWSEILRIAIQEQVKK